jgi:hypothetical protein
MTILELQNRLDAANDFHYPAWWGAAEKQQHRSYIADLEDKIDDIIFWTKQDEIFETRHAENERFIEAAEHAKLNAECDAFEDEYDKHIEEMACGGFDY